MDPTTVRQLAEKQEQDAEDRLRDIRLLQSRIETLQNERVAILEYAKELRHLAVVLETSEKLKRQS